MSTPKILKRDISLALKRENSFRNNSRERVQKDSDLYMTRKRYKLQPYSSFEDKFIEQEKINKLVWENIQKLDEKNSRLVISEEIQRVCRLYETLETKINDLALEFKNKNELINEILQSSQIITHQINKDLLFRDKSNEKNKILFEEVVRLGKNTEICEKNITILQKKLKNASKLNTSNNFPDLQSKINSIESIMSKNIETLSNTLPDIELKIQLLEESIAKNVQVVNTDQQDLYYLKKTTEGIKAEVNTYIFDLQSTIKSQINAIFQDMVKRIQNEGEDRLKTNSDFKYFIDITSQLTQEKFTNEISYIKQDIVQLDNKISLELLKKEEYLKNLNKNFEAFSAEVFKLIKEEKNARSRVEAFLIEKAETMSKKMAEGFEEVKSEQSKATKGFSDTFYIEIETRTQAERELKCMIEIATKDIYTELKSQYLKIEDLSSLLTIKESDIRNSIIEKADIISRFIEAEIKKIEDIIDANYKNSKECIEELTESMKNNIINQEKWKNYMQDQNKIFYKNITDTKGISTDLIDKNNKKFVQKIRDLQEYTEKKAAGNYRILENRIDSLCKEIQKALDASNKISEENQETVLDSIKKLDERLYEIDTEYSNDLKDISEAINSQNLDINSIIEASNACSDLIVQLETQIDLKITNEKFSREHMVNYFQQELYKELNALDFAQRLTSAQVEALIKSNAEALASIETNKQNYEDICKGFEAFRENIKYEINEHIEDNNNIKEKLDTGWIIIENLKEKFEELQEENLKTRLIVKDRIKNLSSEYVKESYNVLNDLTGRVEVMDILKKLNLIFREMDNNEKETQAMMQIYRKELEFIHEKQEKGLQDAQIAVHEIFDKKITGLRNLLVTEMEEVIKMANDSRIENFNLSTLHNLARKLKK
jgi:hypothetical protein